MSPDWIDRVVHLLEEVVYGLRPVPGGLAAPAAELLVEYHATQQREAEPCQTDLPPTLS